MQLEVSIISGAVVVCVCDLQLKYGYESFMLS